MGSVNSLITSILQNIFFYVQHKKQASNDTKLSKWQKFHFWVNYPFNCCIKSILHSHYAVGLNISNDVVTCSPVFMVIHAYWTYNNLSYENTIFIKLKIMLDLEDSFVRAASDEIYCFETYVFGFVFIFLFWLPFFFYMYCFTMSFGGRAASSHSMATHLSRANTGSLIWRLSTSERFRLQRCDSFTLLLLFVSFSLFAPSSTILLYGSNWVVLRGKILHEAFSHPMLLLSQPKDHNDHMALIL